MRMVRIINETGLGQGTKVVDVETGAEIPSVTAIEIPRFDRAAPLVAEVSLYAGTDILAGLKPKWGEKRIKSITLDDGEVVEF